MRPRAFTPIETVPFVGGRLCLDFTNTTGNRAGAEPRERLGTYRDLVVFARRQQILDEAAADALLAAAEADPERAARELRDLIALRESLYRLFLAAAEGRPPPRSDLDLLNRRQALAFAARKLEWSSDAPRWDAPDPGDDPAWLAARIVISAAELLTSDDLDLLRKCGECDWLFLDSSKNRSRRWCKKACGDRVKARRYYRRKKENR